LTGDKSWASPAGIRLLPVTDGAGVALLIQVHERVFGTDQGICTVELLRSAR
jgi:hypothetical protein